MTGKNVALVFSGGGARGAFQIGAWRALKECALDQKVCAVYGTSVGAINGAAFVQGDFELAMEIWRSLNYENVFHKINETKKRLTRSDYVKLAKAIVAEKGLNVDPLKNLLRETLDEELIRRSPLDFGMVVYDLTNRRPKYITKKDIPEGHLVEYVIASATFPLFQPHRIDDTLFIDGGVIDNRPLDFVDQEDQVGQVICVDVTIARHFWKNKRPNKDVSVNYLRPSRLLGSPMAFRTDRIRKNMDLGYKDAMRQIKHQTII